MHDWFLGIFVDGDGSGVDPRLGSHVTKTNIGIPEKHIIHYNFDIWSVWKLLQAIWGNIIL